MHDFVFNNGLPPQVNLRKVKAGEEFLHRTVDLLKSDEMKKFLMRMFRYDIFVDSSFAEVLAIMFGEGNHLLNNRSLKTAESTVTFHILPSRSAGKTAYFVTVTGDDYMLFLRLNEETCDVEAKVHLLGHRIMKSYVSSTNPLQRSVQEHVLGEVLTLELVHKMFTGNEEASIEAVELMSDAGYSVMSFVNELGWMYFRNHEGAQFILKDPKMNYLSQAVYQHELILKSVMRYIPVSEFAKIDVEIPSLKAVLGNIGAAGRVRDGDL